MAIDGRRQFSEVPFKADSGFVASAVVFRPNRSAFWITAPLSGRSSTSRTPQVAGAASAGEAGASLADASSCGAGSGEALGCL